MKMDKNRMVPSWVARRAVPETKEATKELLQSWASLINVHCADINTALGDEEFLEKACEIANTLEDHLWKTYPDYKPPNFGIWVGFPQTPIGRLNAQLAARIHAINHYIEQLSKTSVIK